MLDRVRATIAEKQLLQPGEALWVAVSGGVDSSIVSALAARHHKHLHTFSIGYADPVETSWCGSVRTSSTR